jgi:hypothetical protein
LEVLRKIVKRLNAKSAQQAYYGLVLGAIGLTKLRQTQASLSSSLSPIDLKLFSRLIEDLANGEDILDSEILERAEEAIIKSNIAQVSRNADFLQGYAF